MHPTRISILCMALLLTACETVRYDYKPPASASGKQCVVQCASVREMCRANENQRVQSEKGLCERRSETTYFTCMRNTRNNKDLQAKCDKERPRCYESANYSRCDTDYNQCFSNCGGTITKIIEKS